MTQRKSLHHTSRRASRDPLHPKRAAIPAAALLPGKHTDVCRQRAPRLALPRPSMRPLPEGRGSSATGQLGGIGSLSVTVGFPSCERSCIYQMPFRNHPVPGTSVGSCRLPTCARLCASPARTQHSSRLSQGGCRVFSIARRWQNTARHGCDSAVGVTRAWPRGLLSPRNAGTGRDAHPSAASQGLRASAVPRAPRGEHTAAHRDPS